jgi:hypothetical protein
MLGRPGNNVKIGIVGVPNVGKSSCFNVSWDGLSPGHFVKLFLKIDYRLVSRRSCPSYQFRQRTFLSVGYFYLLAGWLVGANERTPNPSLFSGTIGKWLIDSPPSLATHA